MNILITGGSGFVGARLASRLLEEGHEVAILDVQASKLHPDRTIIGDIRKVEDCRAAMQGIDVVYHLAALYRDDVRPRELYRQVNVEGTRNIVGAASELNIHRIIFTSSFSVYGLDDAGKSEDGALTPVNEYGRTKMEGEKILLEWQAAAPGRAVTMIRPSVIFGEGNRGNVWTLVNQIHRGRFVMIGRGENRKSMAYVGNVVEFLLFLLSHDTGPAGIFNFADKPDLEVHRIVSLAAETLGRKVWRMPLPRHAAMAMGYLGDFVGTVTGRVPTLNSERIRKFLADTSLPTGRLLKTGFSAPYPLQDAFVSTFRHEFGTVSK